MGDWLEGNKMRTQSMLQARQMSAQHDQRAFDNLMKGMTFARDTAMPYVQKEIDVAKAKDLYGPEGVMSQYETGQKELDAKLKSEANIKSFKAAYPNIPAFDVDDKGNPTKPSRAYMMYTFGFDPEQGWARINLDRDKQYGGVVDALKEGFSYYGKNMNDMMVINPETGAAEGFDPNDKSKLIDNLTMTLQRHEQAYRWGTNDPRKARQLATEWVNTAEWKEMQKASQGFADDTRDSIVSVDDQKKYLTGLNRNTFYNVLPPGVGGTKNEYYRDKQLNDMINALTKLGPEAGSQLNENIIQKGYSQIKSAADLMKERSVLDNYKRDAPVVRQEVKKAGAALLDAMTEAGVTPSNESWYKLFGTSAGPTKKTKSKAGYAPTTEGGSITVTEKIPEDLRRTYLQTKGVDSSGIRGLVKSDYDKLIKMEQTQLEEAMKNALVNAIKREFKNDESSTATTFDALMEQYKQAISGLDQVGQQRFKYLFNAYLGQEL
jgi:hypothetical protein